MGVCGGGLDWEVGRVRKGLLFVTVCFNLFCLNGLFRVL